MNTENKFIQNYSSETPSQIPMVSSALKHYAKWSINPLNTELNPICHLLALLGAHHILHISRVTVKRWKFNIKILTLYHQHWELNENIIQRKLNGEFHHNLVKEKEMDDDDDDDDDDDAGDCVIILKWTL